ncbi:MAG: extracellular solute-binding protein [Fimbriimonadaceae bacterium]|nr:extracellular solute-binding protein [Alphaproteobacteria bacterium]
MIDSLKRRAAAVTVGLVTACSLVSFIPVDVRAEPVHGISMHGELLYPSDFKSFSYVNPDAPKGGAVTFGALGSFDSLNPLIVKGTAASGLRDYVFESLMARSYDEPFALYGLLARNVEMPDDRASVTFYLHPDARFSDGKPVTVDDVIFSHALLRDHGRPNHRFYYAKVAGIERVGDTGIRFVFNPDGDREMPLIMGLMPVLPRHIYDADTFEQTTLTPPVASGPYIVDQVEAGSRLVYRRDPDYWGRDLAVNRGRFNFDQITIEYFRDANSLFEGFKKGLFQIRPEGDPGRWARGYDFPAVKDGRVILEEFDNGVPSGMAGLVFNTRKDIFSDIRVRRALTLLFDFEWLNKNLFFDAYARTQSYFDKSELSSFNRPASAREREILAPYLDRIPAEFLDGSYRAPAGDGSGRNRNNRRAALKLMEEAGYRLESGKLTSTESGQPFEFEILVSTKDQERLALSYATTLAKAGITAHVRLVDSAQYQSRRQTYDYDMIQNFWYGSLSPGNEQNFYWGGDSASTEGTRNYMGARDPAIDVAIKVLLEARSRADFVSAVRALDRVLMSGHYVIPLFHLPKQWVARWAEIERPLTTSLYGYKTDTWWHRDAK